MMGWGPNSTGDSADMLAPDQTASVPATGGAGARPRCPECGVIVSMQEVEGHDEAGNRYEIHCPHGRLRSRVARSPMRTRQGWRTGERVMVIGGVKPPSR